MVTTKNRRASRHGRALAVLLTIGLAAAGTAGPAAGRTIGVPGDAPSIKGAMIRARAGDIILVSCGTYREHDIIVKPGVSLWSGTLQPDCAVIDAGGRGRCLIFPAGADTTTRVVGFTLRGGTALGEGRDGMGGLVLVEDASPTLERCRLVGGRARDGGAVAAVGDRGPHILQSELRGSHALGTGGAVLWRARGAGRMQHCTITGNLADETGGGVAVAAGRLLVDTSLLDANAAGGSGGALAHSGGSLTVRGSVLHANAGGLGGGVLAARGASPRFANCTFHANLADGPDAVLTIGDSQPVFEACLLTGPAGEALAGDGAPAWRRSNIYLAGGAWPAALAAQRDRDGNQAADPLYCAPAAGDLHLQEGSPCLGPDGATIGALGRGCGAHFPPDVLD